MSRSYSQEGEDMILSRLFGQKTDGFYVDIGAHHPKRFSNTFIFYKRGWRGINIDAMPESMNLFYQQRPKDINLEIPISKQQQFLTYFQFNESALNTFDEKLALSRENHTTYELIAKQQIKAYPLKDILQNHLKHDQNIDFMSIDVEGLDLQVLESNDWECFHPSVVLVEILNSSLDSISNDPIYKFLSSHKYRIYAKAVNTIFFVSNKFFITKLKSRDS